MSDSGTGEVGGVEAAAEKARRDANHQALTARLLRAFASDEPIIRHFRFDHLPPHLRSVSHEFASLAVLLMSALPRDPERSVALRKLLEGKDAAVRAAIPKDAP